MTAICLILVSNAFAQDVAICYDAAVEGGGGLAVPNPDQLAEMMVQELADKELTAEIVDSAALAEYMKANPKGIFVATQGIMPGTIFKKQDADDLIHSWLRGGGIGAFIGDYAFYYYWDPDTNARVTAAGGGQASVFGATVTNGTVTEVVPTDLGKKYMPSLQNWTSNRATGLAALKDNNFEYESYADDGTNADPIAYRTEDMEGWFINFHTSCCGTAIPPNNQIAKEYAELIKNRFAPVGVAEYAELIKNRFAPVGTAVEAKGKLSVVWGQLKSGN
jgi:hypothetical protein